MANLGGRRGAPPVGGVGSMIATVAVLYEADVRVRRGRVWQPALLRAEVAVEIPELSADAPVAARAFVPSAPDAGDPAAAQPRVTGATYWLGQDGAIWTEARVPPRDETPHADVWGVPGTLAMAAAVGRPIAAEGAPGWLPRGAGRALRGFALFHPPGHRLDAFLADSYDPREGRLPVFPEDPPPGRPGSPLADVRERPGARDLAIAEAAACAAEFAVRRGSDALLVPCPGGPFLALPAHGECRAEWDLGGDGLPDPAGGRHLRLAAHRFGGASAYAVALPAAEALRRGRWAALCRDLARGPDLPGGGGALRPRVEVFRPRELRASLPWEAVHAASALAAVRVAVAELPRQRPGSLHPAAARARAILSRDGFGQAIDTPRPLPSAHGGLRHQAALLAAARRSDEAVTAARAALAELEPALASHPLSLRSRFLDDALRAARVAIRLWEAERRGRSAALVGSAANAPERAP